MMPDNLNLEQKVKYGNIERPEPDSTCWKLSIEPGGSGRYHWAQLDDYTHLPRGKFRWQPPVSLSLQARVSKPDLPGTWGFGFWNDPFNASLGIGGTARRLPALPNTAWFFNASPPNFLSFRDDLPAQGLLAATFRSPLIPLAVMAAGLPLLPFLKWPWMAKKLRKLISRIVRQDSILVDIDSTQWHAYSINWQPQKVKLSVDDRIVLETSVSPLGKGGLVLWIDNQYATFTPDGRLSFGTLPLDGTAWLEIKDLSLR